MFVRGEIAREEERARECDRNNQSIPTKDELVVNEGGWLTYEWDLNKGT